MTTAERFNGHHAAATYETSETLLDAVHAASTEELEADEQPSIEQIAAKEAAARLVFKTFMARGLLGFDATPSASEGIRQLRIHAAARRSRYYPAPSVAAPAYRLELKRNGKALQEERGRMDSDEDFDMQAQMLVRCVASLQRASLKIPHWGAHAEAPRSWTRRARSHPLTPQIP